MAVPKRKMSRSNTRHRRAQWKASAPDLVPITILGERFMVPRSLIRAYQRGLISVDELRH
ncbi:MAG: 50S ribosomal protein L32 [Propionibacteriaceae bacterium]|nr:50S ribosomal protein L32 [Propionibacteriaceae bacterium]